MKREKYARSLCLIILESQAALGVHVLLAGFRSAFHSTIRDDNATPGPAISYDPQWMLTHALHQLHISLGKSKNAAVIVIQDHYRRQARRDEHCRLRHVAEPKNWKKDIHININSWKELRGRRRKSFLRNSSAVILKNSGYKLLCLFLEQKSRIRQFIWALFINHFCNDYNVNNFHECSPALFRIDWMTPNLQIGKSFNFYSKNVIQ